MDLVYKEKRALPGLATQPCRIEHFFQISDPGEDRRDLLKIKIGRAGKQARDGGLAGSGRTPEDQRAKRARLEHAGKRAVRTQQMILADDIGQSVGTKLVGEGARRSGI